MEKYWQYLEYFNTPHSQSFQLLDGKGKIVISAPHSVAQTRNGMLKFSEPHTGVLAKMVRDELGIPIIYKLANLGDDANYDEVSDYKTALLNYIKQNDIKFVLDLHQLAPSRDELLNIGTGGYKNVQNRLIVEMMEKQFVEHGFDGVTVDKPFTGGYPHTVSAFVAREAHIQSIQLEINSRLVIDSFDEFAFDKLLCSLIDITKELEKLL